MAAFNMDKEMKKINTGNVEMSPLVRSRLDETYALIAQQSRPAGRRKPFRSRRLAITATAAGVLAAGLFTSAFLSPAMASSLKNIPVIGSIFSTIQGDMGLRIAGELGLTSAVNRTVSYEDVRLEVTETLYDGNRAAFLLHITAPNLDNGIYNNGDKKMKLSHAVSNVFMTADVKQQGEPDSILQGGVFYGGAGEAHPDTLVFEATVDPQMAPESFDSTVTVVLDGIDHEFAIDVPFSKTTDSAVETSPNSMASSEELTFSVTDVWVTPITTRLKTSLSLNDAATLTEKEEKRLIKIGVAVFDDQGRRLTALNGDGIIEGNALIFDRRYASQPGTSKYFIVKPFVIKDDFAEDIKDDQYLKELETKIELPLAK